MSGIGEDPISYPQHQCGECKFYEQREDLAKECMLRPELNLEPHWFEKLPWLLGVIGPEDKVVEVGTFTLSNWTGHSKFYLFLCPECKKISLDYPHGYASDGLRGGLLYLNCQFCGFQLLLYKKRFYQESGLQAPESLLKYIRNILKVRFSRKPNQ